MARRSYAELRRELEAVGCELRAQGKGSHEKWYSPLTERSFIVPSSLKGNGTEKAILRDSGLDRFEGMPPKLRKKAIKEARKTARAGGAQLDAIDDPVVSAPAPRPPLPHRQPAGTRRGAPEPGAPEPGAAEPRAARPHSAAAPSRP